MKLLITKQKSPVFFLTLLILFGTYSRGYAQAIDPPLSERTPQVREAIVAAVLGVNAADDVTAAHLAAITTLNVGSKRMTSLKSGDFDGLTALTTLGLNQNSLGSLPDGIFDELTALTTLHLSYNNLESLPDGIFDELTVLTTLGLAYNSIDDISELEDLTSLTTLYLALNPIEDYAPLHRLAAAIKTAGRNLTLDINIPPQFTEGASTTRTVAENTVAGIDIGTAVTATDADDDTLTYTLSGTDASSFSIVSTSGQLQTNAALNYEAKTSHSVTVSVSDGRGGSDTIDVTINLTDDVNEPMPVNYRTQQVQDAIVAATPGVNAAEDVTAAHLATISALNIGNKGMTSLKSGDFDGLTALTDLNLHRNALSSLPDGIFDELTALTTLSLLFNELSSLPDGIFDELTALTTLNLAYNHIGNISELEGLTSLTTLYLALNPISDYVPLRRLAAAIKAAGRSLTLDIKMPNQKPTFTDGISTTRTVVENTASGTDIGDPFTATDPDGDPLTYILSGTDAASFSIVSTTGQLQTNAALDYETKTSYSVTISVSDGNIASEGIDVTISVTNINEAPVFTAGDSAMLSIAENTVSGTDIGTAVGATDVENDRLTYTLEGADAASFSIVNTTGQLQTNAALDYETGDSYSVSVSVSDGNGGSDSIDVTINVSDANDAPVFADGDSTTRAIAENTASGTDIGAVVAATDQDADVLTYTLSGQDAASFSIASATGQLQTNAALDYETDDAYSVTVSVSDGNGGSDSIDVTINVSDANDAPVFADGDSTTRAIAENTASGTDIGAVVAATDQDADVLTYTLSGQDAASFSIVSTTGQLQTNAALDYETDDAYSVTVSVSDGNGGSDSIDVTINVSDANDAPVFADGDSTTRAIAENTASGTDIGAVVAATDQDADVLTYTLSGQDAASFSIVSTTGQLQTNAALNYETKTSYSVSVSVSDGNGGSDSIDVTINVSDVYEPIIHRTQQVQDAIVAATPGVSTPDDVTTAHLAAFITFNLTNKGITSLKSGDFDGLTALTALSLYKNHLSSLPDGIFDELTALTVLNLSSNDLSSLPDGIFDDLTALTMLGLSSNDLSSLPDGIFDDLTALTTLSLSDTGLSSLPDGIFDELTALTELYLQSNAISDMSELEDLTSLRTLYVSGNPISDYGPLRKLAAAVKTAGGSLKLDINIPPEFTDGTSTTRSIAENTASGTDIGTAVAATDADDDTLTYTLSGTDEASFSIVSTSGQLQTNAALNYETKTSYSVTVSVSDGNGGSDSIDVMIEVIDVYEPIIHRTQQVQDAIVAAIPGVTSADDVTTAHLAAISALNLWRKGITSLKSDDFDGLTALTMLNLYRNALSSLPDGIFDDLTALTTLNLQGTGLSSLPDGIFEELTVLTTLSLNNNAISDISELEDLTSLTTLYLAQNPISDYGPLRRLVAAIKTAGGTLTLDVTIPPEFTAGDSTTRTIAENTTSGTDIGTAVAATDADGDTLTYTLSGTDASSFSIVSTSGQLQTNIALDYETKNAYSVRVSVSDGNGGNDSIDVKINVTDVYELTPVNHRTQQVQDAIIAAIEGVDSADDVTEVHLAAITILDLGSKGIASLKSGDFDGLTTLTSLDLSDNKSLRSLPSDIFDDLTALTTLNLGLNSLSSLPSDIFDDLTALTTLHLHVNGLGSLPDGIFDELTALTTLGLALTGLGSLPDGIFDELTALTALDLQHNNIRDISELEDLTSLTTLYLKENSISDYGPLRRLVTAIKAAGRSLWLDINIPPEFTDGTSTTRTVEENTASGTDIGTAVTATDADDDTLTYTLSGTDEASFSIVSTSGQLQTNAALNYETKTSYSVTVSVSDGNGGTDTVDVKINVTDVYEPIIHRTQQVQDAIIAAIDGVDSADDVTAAHLAAITTLNLSFSYFDQQAGKKRITSLKSGDFDGLTALTILSLIGNKLSSLPDGIFDELTALTTLVLMDNEIRDISELEDLTSLSGLGLSGNPISDYGPLRRLKAAIEADGRSLTVDINIPPEFTDGTNTTRTVAENTASGTDIGTAVSATDADGGTLTYTLSGTDEASFSIVSATGQLQTNAALNYEIKTSYSVTVSVSDGNGGKDTVDVKINVTDVYEPIVHRTQQVQDAIVAAIPGVNTADDVTEAHLAAITTLDLTFDSSAQQAGKKRITSLKSGDFDGLTALTTLDLSSNELRSLPSGIFDELTALTGLALLDNNIRDISELEDLTSLDSLLLGGNPISDYGPLRRLKAAIEADGRSLNLDIFNPAFPEGTSTTRWVVESTTSGTDIGPPVAATDADNDTLTYHLSGTDASSFSIVSTSGQLQTKAALHYETKSSYSVRVSVSDGNGGTDTIDVTIKVIAPVNHRTQQVQNAIVAAVPGVNAADDVTTAHLAAITTLNIGNKGMTSLKSGDFDGLTALTTLGLNQNSLGSLPSGVFDGLTALTTLNLSFNNLNSLPSDVFDGLTALTTLNLAYNHISDISELEDLTSLTTLYLALNPIADYAPLRRLVAAIEEAGGSLTLDIKIPVEDAARAAPSVETSPIIPDRTALLTNFPNPFNPETWIPYQLAKPAEVTLTIYNIRGVVVRELKLGYQTVGVYHSRSRAIHWDGRNAFGEKVATGLYFYTLKAGDYTATRKLLIRK